MLIGCCGATLRPIAVPVSAEKTFRPPNVMGKGHGIAESSERGGGKAKVIFKADG